jgi:3-deoxy-7-phosphoheptulonate synthase
MISLPVGLKNPTSGSIEIGVNNVIAAQHPHVFFYRDKQISSKGNPYAHLVLRGGSGKSNTSKEELELAVKLLREKTKNPAIIVDVSHDNSLRDGKKDPRTQPGSIMRIREYGIKEIKGFMVESFLKEGKQDITTTKDLDLGGISITDACLGWEETQQLILDLYKQL